MLNLRRVFLVALGVVYVVCVAVSQGIMSQQRVLRQSQAVGTLSLEDCYSLGLKDGLTLSYDEYVMVCSVVQGETAGADLQWSELVAEVIKNRVASSSFPDSIGEVLTQPSQFDAIQNYYDGISVNAVTSQAVVNVFTSRDYLTAHRLKGATYYCNPDILDEDVASWFDQNLHMVYDAYYYSNGCTYHHVFYRE